MVAIPVLHTERLVLRPFSLADAPRVEALLATPEIADTTTVSHPYPEGAGAAWIATHPATAAADQGLSWAITLPDDTVVGTISLSLTPAHRRASAGYWLGVNYWNHGYTSEALCAVIAWAFDDLGYARVEAMCLARNVASGRVMAKAGMAYEGRLRSYIVHHGVSEDLLLYAIVKDMPTQDEGTNDVPRAARVICVDANRLLVVRHDDDATGRTWWVPPGGGRERDETPEQAAIRETYEETGIRVVLRDRLPVPPGWSTTTNAVFLAETMESQVPAPTVDLAAERYLREARWWPIDSAHPLGPLDAAFWGFLADPIRSLLR